MGETGRITEVGESNPRDFRTTHWSVVLEAAGATAESRSALEKLCCQYWNPLYAFIRKRGYAPHQAQDLTQEFFSRFLELNSLEGVDPSKGRFRTFLLAALKHFLANEWRDSNRMKRGGGREFISWEDFEIEERMRLEPASLDDPEVLYDLRWAQTLVTLALNRLEREYELEGMPERFNVLKVYLQGGTDAKSCAKAGNKLGLSESAIKSTIFRMRRRYAEVLRAEITNTVSSPGEVEEEIRHLITVLSANS